MTFWFGSKVLVTGGAGFIGSHLVEMLVSAGARVRVVGRLHKARQLLCYEPQITLESGLAETIEWYKAHTA